MTEQILVVFGVLVGAIVLFGWGRIRVDIVAILVVLALMLSHVLTPDEALAGFGNPVVILIAAIFIVGEGLVNTGVAHRLGEAVMRLSGGNETRLIVLVMLLAGGIGAFMSSTAIVAMFIPVVLTIAKKAGLNNKRMPHAAVSRCADQRDDDTDCIVAQHDRRRRPEIARSRFVQLF